MSDLIYVVRCKDCKYYNKATGWCKHHSYFWDCEEKPCKPWESNEWKMFEPNDYCSWGKEVGVMNGN